MAYLRSIVAFLCLGLILNFVVEQSTAQHLRWGKRDGLETEDFTGGLSKLDNMESNLLQMLKRAYLAGKYSNERRNIDGGKLFDEK